MKKILILLGCLFFNYMAQSQSIMLTGPDVVEVGVTYNYTATYKPNTANGGLYFIKRFQVQAEISGVTITGGIQGGINNTAFGVDYQGFPPNDYKSTTVETKINFSVKWGDGAPSNARIYIQFQGTYGSVNSQGSFSFGTPINMPYIHTDNIAGYPVTVRKVCPPTISTPQILDCCTNSVQICASNYCDANKFSWNISGGIIVSGQGTDCVTVQPNTTGTVIAYCTVGRSQGVPDYAVSSSQSISRTARTATFNTNPVGQNFVCKSGGLQFVLNDQCGIDSVVWNAPNCFVSSEVVVDGKRQVTITPNTSVAGGTIINVNASVNFLGGCTITTPSKPYFIYDNSIPPVPVGSASGNSTPSGVANAPFYTFRFVPTGGYTAGQIIIDPSEVERQAQSFNQVVSVCYFNPCTGVRTCKNFTARVPGRGTGCADCPPLQYRLSNIDEQNGKFNVYPNPTNGLVVLNLSTSTTGDYKIYDLTGKLIIDSKFTNQTDLQIDLSNLQNSTYILKVSTANDTFTKKLILNNK